MAKKTKKKLDQLNETGRRKSEVPVSEERRKNTSKKPQRRRQIDPTTCERDYNDAEIEFMQALDDYKRASGRMFPTCSEILEVLMKIGYQKTDMTAGTCCQTTDTHQCESVAQIDQIEGELEMLD